MLLICWIVARSFFYSNSTLSVKNLMFPSCITYNISETDDNLVISFLGIESDADRRQNLGVMELIAATDHTFSEFCQSVRDGKFHRFGGRVSWRKPNFQIGDFVLVLLNTGVKYALIDKVISKHTVQVKLLNKNMKKKTQTRLQSFSSEQITLLYRKIWVKPVWLKLWLKLQAMNSVVSKSTLCENDFNPLWGKLKT